MENQTEILDSTDQPGPFDQPNSYRTLALQVENRKFYVPRELMAAYSPVFETMLYGNFAESKKDLIELKEKKADDIEELLLCLIPSPHLKDIDDSNLQSILALSDEYQIKELFRRAKLFLTVKMKNCGIGDQKLLEILRLGSKYRMKDLLEECVKRCALEFTFATMEPMFKDLPSEVVAGLMMRLACYYIKSVSYEPHIRELLSRMP